MNNLYSEIRGFTYNNKHNHDMGVVMHSKSIQSPSKKKIKESVPFMNGSYDFSTVGSNGEITYTEREITIILGLPADSKEQLQILYSNTMEWLMDIGQGPLVFDDIPDYYYSAEIENASSFEQVMSFGQLTVTFVAESFKTSIDYVGENTWDLFNFEEDYLQDIEFDVVSSKNVTIYNPGRNIIPTVTCNSNFTATLNGVSTSFVSGNNRNWLFKLKNGENNISISGTGHIKFIFRKEKL